MPAPKLLLLTTDLLRGGTPSVVRELATRLTARSHQVEVASLASLGETGSELRAAGLTVHPLEAKNITDLFVIDRLARLIRYREYTHVFSLLLHANAAAVLASKLTPKSVRYYQSIQTTQPNPRWHWELQRYLARGARRVIVPSPSVADLARHRCDISEEKLTVIPNALDPADYLNLPRTTSSKFRVGFLGRFDPIKRIQDLLHTAPHLGPAYELHLYGTGPELPYLQSLAKTLPGTPITFHGPVARPQDALAHLDALVLPSLAEGFGLVLIEAMAAGVPIVASHAPGIRDVATHLQTALLYPTANIPALTASIKRLHDEPTLRQSLTQSALTHVHRHYTWPTILPQYESALDLPPLHQ